jgi:hypothetical protein
VEVELPAHETNRSPPSSAKVKNEWSYTSTDATSSWRTWWSTGTALPYYMDTQTKFAGFRNNAENEEFAISCDCTSVIVSEAGLSSSWMRTKRTESKRGETEAASVRSVARDRSPTLKCIIVEGCRPPVEDCSYHAAAGEGSKLVWHSHVHVPTLHSYALHFVVPQMYIQVLWNLKY